MLNPNLPIFSLQEKTPLKVKAFLGIFLTSALFRLTALKAARSFHRKLLATVLRLPMAFFDTTPLGRVLNRFSKDVYIIDEVLQNILYSYLQVDFVVVFLVGGWAAHPDMGTLDCPGFTIFFKVKKVNRQTVEPAFWGGFSSDLHDGGHCCSNSLVFGSSLDFVNTCFNVLTWRNPNVTITPDQKLIHWDLKKPSLLWEC